MEEARKKKIELTLLNKNADIAFFLELQKMNDFLEKIANKQFPDIPAIPETKFPAVQTVRVEGFGYLKGEKGDIGEQGIQGLQGYEGLKGKDGRDGFDGKDGKEGRNGLDGHDGRDGRDGMDGNNAEEVDEEALIEILIEKIKKEKVLDLSNISGAQSFLKDGVKYKFEELMRGGGSSGGGVLTYSVDLSSQCNGSNKIFTVPANTNFITLIGTDAPINYRMTTDYTGSGTTTLTLTAAVNAPSSGATLTLLYIK